MEENKSINEFYSNLIHELRTPLSLIISPAEQIIRESSDVQAKAHAEIIQRNSSKLLKLINEMLDISKMENNKMSLVIKEGDIVVFISNILEAFSPYVTYKNISLLFYSEFPELHILFDSEKLEKVMNNIVTNATKFTKPGGKVTVKLSLSDANHLQISITDTGIGITKEKLPHIFDRFFQGDTKRYVDHDGTGIGLSYCKELVQLMNGRITAESVVDIGSEFTIELPVTVITKDIKQERLLKIINNKVQKKPKESPVLIPDEDSSMPLLMIVDDSEDMRKYLASFFESSYEIILAEDGLDAYEKAMVTIPDVIVSDIIMPRMDGFGLCEQLKTDTRTSHIPIVLLTSAGTAENRIRGFETGADDYLSKPFNAYELSVRIKNLIDNRQRLRTIYAGGKPASSKIKYSEKELHFLTKLQNFIETQLSNENLTVDELSEEAAMSSSQLNRKMKALLNMSPNQFLRKYRLTRAKEMLERREGNVSEVSYKVGFNSPAYFTKCFSEEFEVLPSDIK